ncbi:MAG: NAD-dependent epimerase [Candidatus Competibacteraceae bacterium]|nr:NAD-dependent epimerase [Candidatus Competibacteraceae bacterium]
MKKVLITGVAGFIGFHLARRMKALGYQITGIDNVNDYYEVSLKWARLAELGVEREAAEKTTYITKDGFTFHMLDMADMSSVLSVCKEEKFDAVIHLAAQAGVRYSLTNPQAYTHSNIDGFLSVIEGCRQSHVQHFIYASTSSVYGLNTTMPFSVKKPADHPISLYAATKKANEMMAHAYSHLYQLPTTGIRFFSVYGPWGRPDMALFIFTKNILEGKPIQVYNHGNMQRDFTYVSDIVNGIIHILHQPPQVNQNWHEEFDPSTSSAPYKLVNIGNRNPVNLMDFIREIEENLQKDAIIDYLPMQPGDVPVNIANVDELVNEYGYRPTVTVAEGVKAFVDWYKTYYRI